MEIIYLLIVLDKTGKYSNIVFALFFLCTCVYKTPHTYIYIYTVKALPITFLSKAA